MNKLRVISITFYFYYFLFINYLVNGIHSQSFFEQHTLQKRQSKYRLCLKSFEIYEDKIIRTQDSRENGAKYINEQDVLSREDCLKLCCETENCDVFIFEEKSPGSCYLFQCGPPDDFKCKFTRHLNYTSAALSINKQMSELETQIKFTQHEHELAKLRQPEHKNEIVSQAVTHPTSPPEGNKEMLQLIPENKNKDKKCSNYQFECHTSHECIAIYNACDGIPQCADGSDEGPELDCPNQSTSKQAPQLVVVTLPPQYHQEGGGRLKHPDEVTSKVNVHSPETQKQIQNGQSSPYGKNTMDNEPPQISSNIYQNMGPVQSNQAVAMQSVRNYGREGEAMVPHENDQWSYQYHPVQGGGSQIFNHKGAGLVNQNDHFPSPQRYQESNGGNYMPYNDPVQNDYNMKYNNYYENNAYRMGQQNPQFNNWQGIHHQNEMGMPMDESMMGKSDRYRNEKYFNSGLLPQDYYYDDSVRSRNMQGASQGSMRQPAFDHKAHMELTDLKKDKLQEEAKSFVQTKTTAPPSTTTTLKPKDVRQHVKLSQVKAEKLKADDAFMATEVDGHNASPSGAILSLTFGLLITSVMVVLVGCRIRTVRRRLRRGGKSFTHDADFLVNGMYL